MSGKIFIESKSFLNTGYFHAYLVYQNSANDEFVIRGGRQKELLHPLGAIQTESGVSMSQFADSRNQLQAMQYGRRELDLGGRDAGEVWQQK